MKECHSFFSKPSSCSGEPCGLGVKLGLFLGQFVEQVLLPGIEVPGNDDPDLHQQVAPALALGVGHPFAL